MLTTLRMRIADWRGRGVYEGSPNCCECIFIHIPKAAGVSVGQALNYQSNHKPYFLFQRANPSKFKRFFKFTFVRHPHDRLLSAYSFLKKGGINHQDKAFSETHLTSIESFEQFVKEWISPQRLWSIPHLHPQHYFVADKAGRIQVDFVGRLENIEADFHTVAQRLGIEATLAHKNRSDHAPYETAYDAEMARIATELYAQDFALFDYTPITGQS
ncbi:putative chondroitin 4-O-sulfotransferase [Magnetofaba australis IT-1]|uniref:Putative chondroitin 4-O-sulfotransferase n=2 Tax=Magnetofaba TaxID=1472292 RepID=A0A1Y2K2A7_9PROT|nr:putative chondroitin 4-O-sulfotransferase [Magnetofaba australis IT-1]